MTTRMTEPKVLKQPVPQTYGAVFIAKGHFAGQMGLYDDDDGAVAIVYIGDERPMTRNSRHVRVRLSSLRVPLPDMKYMDYAPAT